MKNHQASKKRILVVDDEVTIANLLSNRLKNWGYDVMIATSGKEGLKMARKENPDLVLLDIRMPDMDGREVCARLREGNEISRPPIPIMFVTALGLPEQIETGFLAGPDDYLVKPFEPQELRARIEACLEKTELQCR